MTLIHKLCMASVITNTLGQNDEKHFIELSSGSKTKTTDLCDIKVPYIVKNKLFLGPGTWNNFYYSPDEIDKSFLATDWELKENRHLFLDHDDQKVSSWVGMVENMYMDTEHNLRGDLVVVDLPTARKLEMGAKFGISCKLGGDASNGAMSDFTYKNHSIVINPAVKTAYINNSQTEEKTEILEAITAMESKRKELGMTVAEFYAIPRDPPSDSKLPLFDADHVRNALARFNQVKDITDTERTTAKTKMRKAAKKFGIKTELSEDNDSQDKQLKVDTMSEITEKELEDIVMNSAWTDFVKKTRAAHPGMGFKEIASKFKEVKNTETEGDETPKEEVKGDEKVEAEAKPEASKELSDLISKLSAKLDSIDTKLSKTDEKISKLEEAKAPEAEEKVEPVKEDKPEVETKEEPAEETTEETKEEPKEESSEASTEPANEPVKEEAGDAVVENKSKVVKEMSDENVEKVMVPAESSKQGTEKELYSTEECDTAVHKAMLIAQGSSDIAKQL